MAQRSLSSIMTDNNPRDVSPTLPLNTSQIEDTKFKMIEIVEESYSDRRPSAQSFQKASANVSVN
jgi:hypothetical protein